MDEFLNATLTIPSATITLDFLNRRYLYQGPNITQVTDHYAIAIWGGKERAQRKVSQEWYDQVQQSLGSGSTTNIYPGGVEPQTTHTCVYGSQPSPC